MQELFLRYVFTWKGTEIRIEQSAEAFFDLHYDQVLIGSYSSVKEARIQVMKHMQPEAKKAELDPGFLPPIASWKIEEFDFGPVGG